MAGTPQSVTKTISDPQNEHFTIPVYACAALANADELIDFVPGYPFEIIKMDFVTVTPITTAGKTATLTPKIDGVAVPGTVTALAGTQAKGVVAPLFVASDPPTYGTATSKIKITGSAVTAFLEGAGYIVLTLRDIG